MNSEADLKKILEYLVKAIEKNDEIRKDVMNWVGTYFGKIISLTADGNYYNLIFKENGSVSLEYGEYPSSDLLLISNTEDITDILTCKTRAKDLIKAGTLTCWGNFHEWRPFFGIIENIMKKQAGSA